MQIKTIKYRLENTEDFDFQVNRYLAAGWTLKKRYIVRGNENYYSALVAELVKDEPILEIWPLSKMFNLPSEDTPQELTVKVKYFDPTLEPIKKIGVGDWIDLRSAEDIELKIGEYRLLRLGVGMILPDGYEAHIVPRSSTPKKFGIVCLNSMGIIDNSYSGDEDEWRFPALAIRDTIIRKGDRIVQFRIVKNQPDFKIEVVDKLNDISRGGIGSTGMR